MHELEQPFALVGAQGAVAELAGDRGLQRAVAAVPEASPLGDLVGGVMCGFVDCEL